jgi:hypothetical protein
VTNDHSVVSDAGYQEAILNVLWQIGTRFRMCDHARWSRGSICFMTVEEA